MRTVERTMFYGAKEKTFAMAKSLRKRLTVAEFILWRELNKKQLGYKFRRQHPIMFFIADFYCHQLKLVIELDGEIHNLLDHREKDMNRQAEIENLGITVLRFTNNEVTDRLEEVVNQIKESIVKLETTLK